MSTATFDPELAANGFNDSDADSDGALLLAFVKTQDDVAFAKVVSRHANLVMGICRRTLGNEQDAEDAFQATFLVLARKANSLRNANSLSAWLHKTAHRIALRVRAKRARRREQPLEIETMTEDRSTLQQIANVHERSTLDEELNRLPDRYRLPLFLCCVEGKSRDDAARQLGWSSGSLKGRLERGRQMLRRRLAMRGISFAIGAALVLRAPTVAQASVSPGVVASTVQAGIRYAAGQSPVGYVSYNAYHLANWSLQTMSITSAKFAAFAMLIVSSLTLGIHWTATSAAGNRDDGGVISLEATRTTSGPLTFVAFLDDDPEESERASERRRREGDRDQPPTESDRRRETDRDRDNDSLNRSRNERPRESDERRDAFRPQTEREEQLYKMIVQLQREVAELRNALRSRNTPARRETSDVARDPEPARREGSRSPERDYQRNSDERRRVVTSRNPDAARWENTREGKIFNAYDKSGDKVISLDEWLAMQEGEMTDERRVRETHRFQDAEGSGDNKMSIEEFRYWFTKGRFQREREGGRRDSAEN